MLCSLKRLIEPSAVVLFHAAGVTPNANSAERTLLRWIEELSVRLEGEDSGSSLQGIDTIRSVFLDRLHRVCEQSRVLILIDALNELERNFVAKIFGVGHLWPLNLSWIVTTTDETLSQINKNSQFRMIELEAITETEAREICRRVCEHCRKKLPNVIIDKLLSIRWNEQEYAYFNPLWLRLAVDELIFMDEEDYSRLGEFDGTENEKIISLLSEVVPRPSSEYSGAFRAIVQTGGRDFLRALCRGGDPLYSCIRERFARKRLDRTCAIGPRHKWKWDSLRFAMFRRFLRTHMIQREQIGLWGFFHKHAQIAAERRYLSDAEAKRMTHVRLADHLWKLEPFDSLRRNELMFHLLKANLLKDIVGLYGMAHEAEDT